jgi:putative hydrolases of HD superfamily
MSLILGGMSVITKSLLELLYEAANIQRWNDHLRPKGFTEIDKQSHKMIIAYVLAKFEESDRHAAVDWTKLIQGGIYEFLHRVVLTDIKPPIYHKLMSESGEKLNNWVLGQLSQDVAVIPGGFMDNFKRYLFEKEYSPLEKKILRASHYLATNWEFNIIYNLNKGIYGVEETRKEIENELEEHYDLAGVLKLGLKKKTYNFIDMVGQLRFQKRWAHSPRVPETSVLGHMLIVAILSYLISLERQACPQRASNNYFAGLFHDLPEVLTRDIISPIKRSVEGLDDLIKEIEKRQVEERILPLLPEAWHKELHYFVDDEFKNKVLLEDQVTFVTATEMDELYNHDNFSPVDGEMIKGCDLLAAYIEASLSVSHGITSRHLQEALISIYHESRERKSGSFAFGPLFDYFKKD